MSKKLLVIDLDGTTLVRNFKISNANKLAIRDLFNAGIKVMIATGRGPNRIDKVYKDLNMDKYSLPIICYNGAAIYDFNSKSFIQTQTINNETSKIIFKLAQKHNVALWGYSSNNKDAFYSKKISLTRTVCLSLYKLNNIKFNNNINDDFIKLSFTARSNNAKNFIKDLEKLNLKIFKHVFHATKQNLWDISNNDCDKFNSIEWYANQNNISISDIAAIGDGENDIKMIQNVGLGIAMGNSIEEVKKVAKESTDRVEKDGLAKAIRKFIL